MGYGKESMKKLHLGCGTNYIRNGSILIGIQKLPIKGQTLQKGYPTQVTLFLISIVNILSSTCIMRSLGGYYLSVIVF